MPKQYIVEQHHLGITTPVSQPMAKWEAIALFDQLEDEAPVNVSYSVKAVRRG